MFRPKYWAAVAAALAVTVATSLSAPSTAYADRCNPDEFVGPVYTMVTGQPYEPVFGHDDGPFCYVMRTVVYPAIGCDPTTQSLPQCVQSQPGRVFAITGGLCDETFSEIYDAYTASPYAVQRYLRPVITFMQQAFACA